MRLAVKPSLQKAESHHAFARARKASSCPAPICFGSQLHPHARPTLRGGDGGGLDGGISLLLLELPFALLEIL
jgi:hypothetical protein